MFEAWKLCMSLTQADRLASNPVASYTRNILISYTTNGFFYCHDHVDQMDKLGGKTPSFQDQDITEYKNLHTKLSIICLIQYIAV